MFFKQSQIASHRIDGDKFTSFCNYSVLPSLNKVYYYYYGIIMGVKFSFNN